MIGGFSRRSALLGEGVLRWPPDAEPDDLDKVGTDLAQTVGLMAEGNRWVVFSSALERRPVTLSATVTALRGPVLRYDAVRGIGPRAPYVGESIQLGVGQMFRMDSFGATGTGVGTMPVDPAADAGDWLDRAGLYRVHNHIVELYAIPLRSRPAALPTPGTGR